MRVTNVRIAAVLMLMCVSGMVHAQSCTQGGVAGGGPTIQQYNLLYDPVFVQTSCPAWQFISAERATSGTMCNSNFYPFAAPFGRATGPVDATIYQITHGQSDFADHFYLSYTVDIVDSLNNPNTRIVAWIQSPVAWYGWMVNVDTPAGGARDCDTRYVDLGHHPDWVDQDIAVGWDLHIPTTGATISITNTGLWQGQ
jgi:hypothetical protein